MTVMSVQCNRFVTHSSFFGIGTALDFLLLVNFSWNVVMIDGQVSLMHFLAVWYYKCK